jgi:hypothetical protein
MCKWILVSGDVVVDHHIYEGRRHHFGDGFSPGVLMKAQGGGAVLVYDLLDHLLRQDKASPPWKCQLALQVPSDQELDASLDAAHHAYAFWRPYPQHDVPMEKR